MFPIILIPVLQMMRSAGLEAKPYVVEDNRILYVAQRGTMEMIKIRAFLLDQAEVLEFEWNNQKSAPSQTGMRGYRKKAKELGVWSKDTKKAAPKPKQEL
jgi:hypothetical protein